LGIRTPWEFPIRTMLDLMAIASGNYNVATLSGHGNRILLPAATAMREESGCSGRSCGRFMCRFG
jgi:hypothetical protein